MLQHNAAKSFVAIMIVIALSAFFLRVAIEQIIRFNIERNESDAVAALKLTSTALENYAKDNKGVFPSTLRALVTTSPPYLSRDYVSQTATRGYSFSCPNLGEQGYSCTSEPVRCGLTGKKVFIITTGGSLASDECKRKN